MVGNCRMSGRSAFGIQVSLLFLFTFFLRPSTHGFRNSGSGDEFFLNSPLEPRARTQREPVLASRPSRTGLRSAANMLAVDSVLHDMFFTVS